MNRRPTQFGLRENTASPRQHASRLVLNRASLQCAARLSNHNGSDDAVPTTDSLEEAILSSSPEITDGNTGELGVSRNQSTKRKRNERQDPLTVSGTTVEGLVDVHDAARFLAVSVSTLYGWVWQRKISFVKVGRAVRFDQSDLRHFVEENRIYARRPRKS
jgi:excisionase family DNA binding protein